MERDPDGNPIPFNALISPDFRFYVSVGPGRVKHSRVSEWLGPNTGWGTPSPEARWELGLDNVSMGWRVRKKEFAHELLRRAMRSKDPTLPNPWEW